MALPRTRSTVKGFILAAGALVAASLTWATLDRGPSWTPLEATVPFAPDACERPGEWWRQDGRSLQTDTVAMFDTATAIATCTQRAGTLTLTLRGTVAAGVGSRVVIVQGSNRLLDTKVLDEAIALNVRVPARGVIVLAFLNGSNEAPEYRSLWISELAFTP